MLLLPSSKLAACLWSEIIHYPGAEGGVVQETRATTQPPSRYSKNMAHVSHITDVANFNFTWVIVEQDGMRAHFTPDSTCHSIRPDVCIFPEISGMT